MVVKRLLIACVVGMTCVAVSASPAAASFGLKSFSFSANESPPAGAEPETLGEPDTRAGSHPWSVTTSFHFSPAAAIGADGEEVPDGNVKDVHVELPPGLIGDVNAIPKCPQAVFNLFPESISEATRCPVNTQVGVVRLFLSPSHSLSTIVVSLVPPPGAPAEFGFELVGVPVVLVASVRSNGDYGITVSSENALQALHIFGVSITFWGVPGDPSHDDERGSCLPIFGSDPCTPAERLREKEEGEPEMLPVPSGLPPTPFLTMPTQCTGHPLLAQIHVDSWQEPGAVNGEGVPQLADPRWQSLTSEPPALSGCEHPGFRPSLNVTTETSAGDTPAGLTADLKIPQDGLANSEGLVAPADLKDTTVTLPTGVSINPGQAAGLAACQASQDGIGTLGAPSCPSASTVGTDVITTPLLPDELEGDVYLLQSEPPEVKLLVSAHADGVYIKLVGTVHMNTATGQLTTVFEETPQLPFSDFKLQFSGGAQAALLTPSACGTYVTNARFTPWTSPFEEEVLGLSSFAITSGPSGAACSTVLPFSPSMIAGSTTDQAGGFTGFSLLLSRGDGQQRLSSLQFKAPAGLLGFVGKVPLCPEPQASRGECLAASQIGHTVIEAGPGPYPLVVPQPGEPPAPIYLTGPYKGAPDGLSIAVPVIAGPFNLGTEVVRSKIEVDPTTTQLTVTTDPFPQIIDGVPTDLRTINAVIDRPEFMINPTNCTPASFSGTAISSEGLSVPLTSRFQVGSCKSLEFKPGFAVSTSSKPSRANGTSLDVKLTYPKVPQGSGANIAKVRVELPKRLPSRLTTLQKACVEATFAANPAACPTESRVGSAVATTPILAGGLAGPVYFVSHGGAKFPELVVVLKGQNGLTVDLHGETFISKQGITSSTFATVPDVPVGSFELKLPQGRYSALAANGNPCNGKLLMPTEIVAQDGAVLKRQTKIAVNGCPRHKSKSKRKSRAARQHGRSPAPK